MQAQTVKLEKQKNITLENGYNIPLISEDRHYWFVRTDSGLYFDDFLINGYIAIGWDYLSPNHFISTEENMLISLEALKNLIATNESFDEYDSERAIKAEITKIINKVKYFICDMSVGDVVIIPSKDKESILVGIITGTVKEVENYVESYRVANPDSIVEPCPYKKRRTVHWLKQLEKKSLDMYLAKAIQAHQAITNLDEYANYINRNLFDNYIINDNFHSLIRTTTDADLTLTDLHFLTSLYVEKVTELSQQFGLSITSDDIKIKINIHCPGLVEFVTDLSQLSTLGEAGLGVALIALVAWNAPGAIANVANAAKDCFIAYNHEETERKRIESTERMHSKDVELKMKEMESRLGISPSVTLESNAIEKNPES